MSASGAAGRPGSSDRRQDGTRAGEANAHTDPETSDRFPWSRWSNLPDGGTSTAGPDTVTVRVPLAFRREGGRKALVAYDGARATLRPTDQAVNSPLVRAIARAFRWRKLIETGAHTTICDLASAERINRSYVSRILRLTLLAPDIVERILDGRPPRISVDDLMKCPSLEWATQRRISDAA